jgi:hypothetical protein
MTRESIELPALESTQAQLLAELPRRLTKTHRDFLLSLAQAEPAWDLMPFQHLKQLPAIQWKLFNLRRLKSRNRARFAEQYAMLAERFN